MRGGGLVLLMWWVDCFFIVVFWGVFWQGAGWGLRSVSTGVFL